MASKADRFYFDNFVAAAEQSGRAAQYLANYLKDYDSSQLETALRAVHELEHAGDKKKHEMTAALAKAFVTPVDREDLALISQNIDDVTDSIEEVLQQFYMDGIKTVLPEAVDFADRLVRCCELMTDMLREFPNFKKPARLHEMIIALNHAEEECDALYLKAVLAVRTHTSDVLEILFWREIYECLESCADACEHVGDCIETVVMKNT